MDYDEIHNVSGNKQNSDEVDSLYDSLIEESSALIFRIRKDLTIVYANKPFCDALNTKRNELIGISLISLLHNNYQSEFSSIVYQISTSAATKKVQLDFVIANQKLVRCEFLIGNYKSSNSQNEIFIQGVGLLLSSSNAIEETNHEYFHLLDAFFKQSLEGVFLSEMDEPFYWNDYVDRDLAVEKFFYNQKITRVNKAFANQYKLSENDILGKPVADLFKHDVEQGKRICREILEKENSIIVSEERRSDGTTLWAECNYYLFKNSKGQITGNFGIQRDITTKVRDEEDINKLLLALKMSKDSILICDTFGKIIYANESTKQMLGHDVSINNILGKEIFRVFKPKNKNSAIRGFIDIQKKGFLLNQESVLITQDGAEIPFELSATLLKDANDNAIGYVVVSRNILERICAQKELMQSEERYRNLFDNSPLPMWIYDPDTLKILSVNQASINSYGYSKEEFLSKTIMDVRPQEDFDKLKAHMEIIKANNDYNISRGWQHIKKDGSVIDVEIWAQGVLFNGIKARIVVIIDVTANRIFQNRLLESEKSFRGIFNSLNDGVFIQNKDGVFLDVNTGAEKMYGYKREEFIGRTPEFLAAPGKNDFGHFIKCIQMTFEGNGPFTFEFWGLKKSGDIFPKEMMINKGTYFGQEVVIAIARDITNRKANELSLAKSENNLRAVFNNISDAIIIHDFNGNIIEVNDRTLEVFQFSKEQAQLLSIKDILAETDMQHEQIPNIFSSVKKGQSLLFEWKAKKPYTGDIFDSEVSIRKSVWSNKEVAFVVIRDISERKIVEKALMDSEESYKGLFNSINDAIYIQNSKGEFLDVNYGAQKMYGYKKEEFIGNTPDFLTAPNKNDLKRTYELIQNTFETGQSNKFDFWGLRNNGEVFPKEVIINKGKYFGQDCLIAIARDISERKAIEDALKESEERYRNLYENSPIGIYRSTPDGKILMSNPTLQKMLGYASEEEINSTLLTDKNVYKYFSRNDILKRVDAEDELIGFETEWITKNNKVAYFRENSKAKRDENGNVIYYDGTIEDITERKLAEEALKNSEKKLRETNLMKDKFFSIIAHDLRSPFQGLIGIANILVEDDELTLEERLMLESKLYEGLKSQFNLLDILLTWNRMQRGVLEFDPGFNLLNIEIDSALEVLKNSIEKKNIIVELEIEGKIEFVFDKNMIATTIRNLISNAVKFTNDYGKITICAKKEPDTIKFIVNDNGIGISVDEQSKLFRIDVQFTKRGTHDEGGTGLGLILCKEFIEKHKGKIIVESEVGKGSSFGFVLPYSSNL